MLSAQVATRGRESRVLHDHRPAILRERTSRTGGYFDQGNDATIALDRCNKPRFDMICSRLLFVPACSVLLLASCGNSGSPAPVPAVVPAPAPVSLSIASFVPTSGPAGTVVTVTGTGMSTITSARVGTLGATFVIDSATQVRVTIPSGAATALIELSAGGETTATSTPFSVSVLSPMTVTSFSPTTIARGQMLTVNGTYLSRAATVLFTGGASASVAARTGDSALTVVVPTGAINGPVTVSAGGTDTATSATALTLIDPVVVTPQTYNVAVGGVVMIGGTGLAAITGVTVNGIVAAISSKTATQLSFTAPAGVVCGPIVLTSASQAPVAAGALVVGAGCTMRIAQVEFAQVMSQTATDPYARLAPAKETWVRAFVVSENMNTTAPPMRAVGFVGTTQLGTIDLVGPPTLPALAAASGVPQSMRDDEALTYNAELPAAWVQADLQVRVEVDPMQQFGAMQTLQATPNVGTQTYIDLVLVPLVSGGNVPTMPALADVVDEITRRLPIQSARIRVALRAPYLLNSVTDGVDTTTEWSAALGELEALRDTEAPGKHYYGMVRPMVQAGTAGIGYVNVVGSTNPSLSSMGWDASRTSWRRTMVHEFGHNFSRRHAPCGGVANPDAGYPYVGGVLGPTPLFDPLTNDVISSAAGTDIMGYCNGAWFSDYNLREVSRFLEARPQPVTLAAASNPTAEVLVISGAVDAHGVRLTPLRVMRGAASSVNEGDTTLRLTMADGSAMEHRFAAVEVDHMPGESHFVLRVPNPGVIASVQISRGAVPMRLTTAEVAAPVRATAGEASNAQPMAAVQGNQLEVSWNAAAMPYATVSLLVNNERHTLTINARGGRVTVPLLSLPVGGELEVSLSDGLNTRLVMLPRPN